MKIALSQINTKIADFKNNFDVLKKELNEKVQLIFVNLLKMDI